MLFKCERLVLGFDPYVYLFFALFYIEQMSLQQRADGLIPFSQDFFKSDFTILYNFILDNDQSILQPWCDK